MGKQQEGQAGCREELLPCEVPKLDQLAFRALWDMGFTLAHFHSTYLNICVYICVKDKTAPFYPDTKQSLKFNLCVYICGSAYDTNTLFVILNTEDMQRKGHKKNVLTLLFSSLCFD